MTTESPLVVRVIAILEQAHVPYALIGAVALSLYGISRSTLDIDLLVTDRRVLEPDFWSDLDATGVRVDARRGDADDPLSGVVRLTDEGSRDVDVVVGRGQWQAAILERATTTLTENGPVRAIGAADLVLLKLYAGGNQDRWDIEQLLAAPNRAALVADVDAGVGDLPPAAQSLWRTVRRRGNG